MKGLLTTLFILMGASSAEARVFDINRDTMAPYFILGGGSSNLGTTAYENAATGVSDSGKSSYNYSGEFGLMISRPRVNVAFGLEILKPLKVENISGTNSGGTELYTASSDVLAYSPKITVEFNLHGDNISRSFIGFAAGYSSVSVKNTYTLTAAGTAAYPGVDTSLEYKGTGTELIPTLGYEGVMSDNITYAFQFGYRFLKIDTLEYSRAYTTFTGPVTAGGTVQNGAAGRTLDLSGGFISLAFRFYM